MLISQTPDEIRATLSLQTRCELKHATLSHCRASVERREEDSVPPFRLTLSRESTTKPITGDGILPVVVLFRAKCTDSSDPRQTIFTIECSFDLQYVLQADYRPSDVEIIAFGDGNAVFNCWPHLLLCLWSLE